jgi:hypothetical protein
VHITEIKINTLTNIIFFFNPCNNFNLTEFIPGSSKDRMNTDNIDKIKLVHNTQDGRSIMGITLYANIRYSAKITNPDVTANNKFFIVLTVLTIPIHTKTVIAGTISNDIANPTKTSKKFILPSFLCAFVRSILMP